jgi:hypothetical protein
VLIVEMFGDQARMAIQGICALAALVPTILLEEAPVVTGPDVVRPLRRVFVEKVEIPLKGFGFLGVQGRVQMLKAVEFGGFIELRFGKLSFGYYNTVEGIGAIS